MSARVLITRELSPASVQLLQNAGVDFTSTAFIQTASYISTATAEAIRQRLPLIEDIVFTSRAAAISVADLLTQQGVEWSASTRVHCLKGASLKAFRESGMKGNVSCTAESARTLAQMIIALHVSNVDFFAGESRRDELPELLQSARIQLHEHIVYKTMMLHPKLEGDWGYILFFSPSALESFLAHNRFPEGATAIAIGSTTAEALRQHEIDKIVISESASEAEMIHTLLNLLQAPQTYKY